MLFALFGFDLFMFNKYHFSFVYCCCFNLWMCIHIYVYTFIYYSFLYCGLFLFVVYFWLSLFDYCYVYFIIFIILCTFYINMYVGINVYFVSHSLVDMYSVLFGLTSLSVNMHTWLGARVQVFGIDTDGIDPDPIARRCWRTHIWEGEVHTEVNILFYGHGMCVFIGNIDTYGY